MNLNEKARALGFHLPMVEHRLFRHGEVRDSELVKENVHTVWVRLGEILSPKGRLLRSPQVIKRHKVKHVATVF
jgi:hypothetical protein